MRVNPNIQTDLLAAIGQTQDQQQTALQQLSTGQRVNRPSDDPAAAAASIRNYASTQAVDQYQQNVSSVRSLLQSADSALSSVVTSLTKAVTLGVQGGDPTLSDSNRQQLAQQVQGILTTVVQLANTSYNGIYVFAGTANTDVPFTADPSSGSVTYQGNSGQNTVAVADGTSVTTSIPGDALFQNSGASVLGSLQQLASALATGTPSDITGATASVRSSLDYIGEQRVFFGNASNQLESMDSYLQQETVSLASQQNDLVGVDVAKAITNFTTASTAHDAALSAGSKVLQISLLDYLR